MKHSIKPIGARLLIRAERIKFQNNRDHEMPFEALINTVYGEIEGRTSL